MKELYKGGVQYLIPWAAIVIIGGLLGQPATGNPDDFWTEKGLQVLLTIPYGLLCWAIFTPLVNHFKAEHRSKKFWMLFAAVWMAGKFIVFGINSLISPKETTHQISAPEAVEREPVATPKKPLSSPIPTQRTEPKKFDIDSAIQESQKFRGTMAEIMKTKYATHYAFDLAKEHAEKFKSNVATIVQEGKEAEVESEIEELARLQRRMFASIMEQAMVKNDVPMQFKTSGPSDEVLKIQFPEITAEVSRDFIAKNEVLSAAQAVGIKRIDFSDGSRIVTRIDVK